MHVWVVPLVSPPSPHQGAWLARWRPLTSEP